MSHSNKAFLLNISKIFTVILAVYAIANITYLGYQSFSFKQSRKYEEKLNKDMAFLQSEAKRGESEAEFILGMKYLNGEGVETNIPKGISWLDKSAKKGNLSAKQVLLAYYFNEEAVRNYKKAFTLAKSLAERKDASSIDQQTLADLYAKGLGVEKSESLAAHWHKKAADSRVREAQLAEKYQDQINKI